MALTECGKGHLYDNNLYGSCPYCNNQQGASTLGAPVIGDNKTMPINRAESAFQSQIPVGNDGLTAPPKAMKSVLDSNKTTGVMKNKMGIEPVVGWVVCIKGPNKGKSYELWGRVNTIGRDDKNDVCLKNDKLISNENHARISYSEKTNHFHIVPADGKNVIYVNGEEIFAATLLKPYDKIDFGETELIFVPLCSEYFKWSDAN